MALQHAALHDYVCLEARGADAAAFLHAQLSRAVADLDPTHAPLAGWADARGRVRALLRVCPLPERWLLVTPRDGADELLKKLRMFVLRSKVTLARAADVGVTALLGDARRVARAARRRDRHAAEPLVRRDEVCLRSRRFGVLAAARCAGRPGATRRRSRYDTTEAAAALAEIGLGLPAITPAVAERFVAQMLNLDELGAVSFDKGCYPGQEIIARVHNLGGVKRRARRYAAASRTARARRAGARGRRASRRGRAQRRSRVRLRAARRRRACRGRRGVDVRRRAAARAAAAVRRAARLGFGLQLREQQHVANRRRVRQQHREPVDADPKPAAGGMPYSSARM